MTKFGKQIAAWLGLLAIGLNALTPMTAWASPARADVPVEICTAAGFRFVPEGPQAPSTPAKHSECTLCAHCVASGGHAALGAANPRVSLPWPDRASTPRRHAATLPTVAWIPGARPRAPPTLFAVL